MTTTDSTGAGRKVRVSGRVNHEEKVTVYCSSEELLALHRARLDLHSDHDLRIDRGRLIREAVALTLADLAARGGASALVQRLNEDAGDAIKHTGGAR